MREKMICPIDGSEMKYTHESGYDLSDTDWNYTCKKCGLQYGKHPYEITSVEQATQAYLTKILEEFKDIPTDEDIERMVEEYRLELEKSNSEKRKDLRKKLMLARKNIREKKGLSNILDEDTVSELRNVRVNRKG
jgi:hypothetical protein